jgi:hypothetical protein
MAALINDFLDPIRKTRQELLKDPGYLDECRQGSKKLKSLHSKL